MRIGYCCINETLKIGTKTITLKKFKTLSNVEKHNKLQELTRKNFDNLFEILKWNVYNNIKMFRVGSDIAPMATINNNCYDFSEDIYIVDLCKFIRIFCRKHDIRLTIHPSQFVVINSDKDNVYKSSVKELEYHYKVCELLNIDAINLHVGGVYDDKVSSMKRFIDNFNKLPEHLKSKIALENDDKSYNVSETLYLSQTCNIPMIVDFHHDKVLTSVNKIDYYLDSIKQTWENKIPLCHISSSADSNKTVSKHHDYILLDDYNYINNICNNSFDIEFECKKKELSILKFQTEGVI